MASWKKPTIPQPQPQPPHMMLFMLLGYESWIYWIYWHTKYMIHGPPRTTPYQKLTATGKKGFSKGD